MAASSSIASASDTAPLTGAPSTQKPRFLLIDALRGLGAIGVMLYHLCVMSALTPALAKALGPGKTVLELGQYGVQIFFVISGFVIAHAMRNYKPSREAAWNFIVRRQLRLDPPYWCILFLTLIVKWIGLRVAAGMDIQPFPSAKEILFHFLYLQNFARMEPIMVVAWTLCLEIQFYLVFIALLSLSAWKSREQVISRLAIFVVALGLISFALALFGGQPFLGWRFAWFIYYWCFFASGLLCYWTWKGEIKPGVLWVWLALLLGAALISATNELPVVDRANSPIRFVIGAATTFLIYLAGKHGQLWNWGGQGVLRYVGRISYSLYLIHVPILAITMRVGYKLTGDNPAAAVMWLVLTGVLCIGAAHVVFLLIEKPSIGWASRFKTGAPAG